MMTNPQEIEIPSLDLAIPEPVIDWAYQAYTNLLLNIVELELEGIPAQLDNLWTAWGELNDRIWTTGFDLVSVMGFVNVLAQSKIKEINYSKSLYLSYKTVMAEAIRSKNLRQYLSTRLEIEKQRQLRHISEQTMNMTYAKGMIEVSVEAFNCAVKEFNANIAAIELESKRWQAVTAINESEIKRLELLLQEARLESEYTKGEIRRQRALAGILQATADVQRILVEIQLNDAKVQLADIDVQRSALQALVLGTQAIEIQAQTLALEVDAAVIRAEGDVLNVLNAENNRISAEILNVNQIRAARDAMYTTAIADKLSLLEAFTVAQNNLIAANTEYANAQIALSTARNESEIARYTSSDAIEDSQSSASDSMWDAQFDSQNSIEDARLSASASVDDAKAAADGTTTGAKIRTEAQQTTAKFQADAEISAAKLTAELTSILANAAHQSKLTQAETSTKIGMDAQKLSADIASMIIKFNADHQMDSSRFGLALQKLVSEWSINRDQESVRDKREDVAHDVILEESAGRAEISQARVAAAEFLKTAKVTNHFTEYRS